MQGAVTEERSDESRRAGSLLQLICRVSRCPGRPAGRFAAAGVDQPAQVVDAENYFAVYCTPRRFAIASPT
jgi:hypothetical protein